MLKAILALTLLFSISARAQSEGDLYQLLHEIENGLDQITLTPSQIQDANSHLLAARAAVYRSGIPSATLTISSGPTFDFGTVATGGLEDFTFMVANSGARTAYRISGGGLASPFQFKGGTFPGTGGTCGNSLQPAASCTIVVTYSPSSTGVQSDTLEISYYDGVAMQTSTRPVLGTSVAPAMIAISDPPTYNFGNVRINGAYADKTFTVANSGGLAATALSAARLSPPFEFPGGYPGYGGTCGAVLAGSATCTIVVRFDPPNLGTFNSSIGFQYNDGAAAQSASRNVTGTGIR